LEPQKKFILIDGHALLYRAFYALPPLTNSEGVPTGAVYGFTRMLMKLLREEKPAYIACAFDKGRKTFRHRRWEEYKATRARMPQDLTSQIPLIKEVLKGFGISSFENEEYEADDLLATLAKKGEKMGLRIEILTSDKDALQTVSSSIYVLRPRKGITDIRRFDEKEVKKKYGVSPSQIPDFLALMGDTSDNIPGVPGIGPVMAKELMQKFKTLDHLLHNLDQLPSKKRNLLIKYAEQARLSKKLATTITSVPLEVNLDELKVNPPQRDLLLPLFSKLEFKQLIKELGPSIFPEAHFYEISSLSDLISLASNLKKTFFVLEPQKNRKIQGLAFFVKDKPPYWLPLKQAGIKKNLIIGKLNPILGDSEIMKIGHDLKTTVHQLKMLKMDLTGLGFDTELAAYLLNPLVSHYPLEDLALNYLGMGLDKGAHPAQRAKIISQLSELLRERLKKENLWELFLKIEMPLIEVLAKMEERGIKVDKATLEDFLKEVKKQREEIQEEIYQGVGEKFNINSSPQLGQILFEKMNLPPLKRTKTGYSTDEEVLQTLSLIYPFVTKILEYRRLFKLESTYIRPFPELINPATGRIHTSFNQTVTATGRLSSSEPNLQNIPIRNKLGQRLRRAFIPENGYLFLSADYSQVELRLLAHLSQDTNLKRAFAKNEDIHRETASEIFGVLPLKVTSQMRRQAKVVNFGIIYGISAYGLSRDLGISQKEAEDYIEKYFDRYPKVKDWIEKTLRQARDKQYVTTLLGRKRRLPGIDSRNKRTREFAERTAINSPVQGGAADLIKLAMINLNRRFKKEGLGAYIILQIHDELLFEVPEAKIDQTRKIVKEEMESAMRLYVPLVVQTKVGKNWGEMRE
jgi:DNA polymerase-1